MVVVAEEPRSTFTKIKNKFHRMEHITISMSYLGIYCAALKADQLICSVLNYNNPVSVILWKRYTFIVPFKM